MKQLDQAYRAYRRLRDMSGDVVRTEANDHGYLSSILGEE
jgi:hypothetical protein